MKTCLLRSTFFLVILACCIPPIASFAGVNMAVEHKLTLENAPVDVVATPDGKYIFVLTKKGDIAVFDEKGRLENKIHVGNEVDQIRMDPKGTRLFVASRSDKTVRVISLDFFVEINTQGAPFSGPQNAPVVLVVFSDFQ